MYNPSRGGVRGGADQFSWDSVKNDKHRENYLGHSLKAPIGRWQKGKDLTWYDKKRNESQNSEKSELEEIKRAEEEAMMIALGHNIVPKESQKLTNEEMKEALKRNCSDRDSLNIERIDGVGVSSARTALLMGSGKHTRNKHDGVMFENNPQNKREHQQQIEKHTEYSPERKRSKKSSKKHKKEKKHKKTKKKGRSSLSDSDNSSYTKHKTGPKTSRRDGDLSKEHSKRTKHKSSTNHSSYDSNSDSTERNVKHSKKRKQKSSDVVKRRRHDTSESD